MACGCAGQRATCAGCNLLQADVGKFASTAVAPVVGVALTDKAKVWPAAAECSESLPASSFAITPVHPGGC